MQTATDTQVFTETPPAAEPQTMIQSAIKTVRAGMGEVRRLLAAGVDVNARWSR